jgi:hypothetical protein
MKVILPLPIFLGRGHNPRREQVRGNCGQEERTGRTRVIVPQVAVTLTRRGHHPTGGSRTPQYWRIMLAGSCDRAPGSQEERPAGGAREPPALPARLGADPASAPAAAAHPKCHSQPPPTETHAVAARHGG